MESDPEKAKETLEDFISYLRSSLPKTRSSLNTLREEMELIRSYLKIFKVRMGPRLEFEINLPEELNGVLLPPMLLQPLVENALKHGLEPKEKGGGIKVSAARQGDKLVLKVSDTGLGLGVAKSPEKGLGLSNVRNRLAALYENKASLILLENQPQGLEAVLEVPLAEDDGHNS
jgi:sensor histidine kinase YesM